MLLRPSFLALCMAAATMNGACTAPRGARDGAAPPAPATRRAPRLDHISPPRDFTGATPKFFEWTAVEGADRYAIGILNEIDLVVWRNDHVPTTSVDWPSELK